MKKNKFKNPFVGYWCHVLWALAFFMAACNDAHKEGNRVYTEEDTAMEVGKEVEILYSDSAVVRVRVTAPVMYNIVSQETPRQEFPQGVRVDFLEPNFSIKSTLTAKTGVRRQDQQMVFVRDSVVLVTARQERLDTEELIWDENAGRVRTDKFVKVTKPGEVIYGYGLEADQDFSYWRITVPKGRIKVDQLKDLQ